MDQLCAHVILLPVKSMHTSPICCSSQADKPALCTHKQTAHFPDIRDCFQSERRSPGSFTQKRGEKRIERERERTEESGDRERERGKQREIVPVISSNFNISLRACVCVLCIYTFTF